MVAELPEYYYRVRDNGAFVFRVDTENRQRRIDMDQIAVVKAAHEDLKARKAAVAKQQAELRRKEKERETEIRILREARARVTRIVQLIGGFLGLDGHGHPLLDLDGVVGAEAAPDERLLVELEAEAVRPVVGRHLPEVVGHMARRCIWIHIARYHLGRGGNSV